MTGTDIALAAVAGAFAFHVWSEIKMIKAATGISTQIISLDTLMGLSDDDEEEKPKEKQPQDRVPFGFNPRSRKRLNRRLRPLLHRNRQRPQLRQSRKGR